jgi:hypothetical protein
MPGLAGAGLDDADEQQREPAQHNVGADALFEVVTDRAQVEDLFHVPPAAFDLEELFDPPAADQAGAGTAVVEAASALLLWETLNGRGSG